MFQRIMEVLNRWDQGKMSERSLCSALEWLEQNSWRFHLGALPPVWLRG